MPCLVILASLIGLLIGLTINKNSSSNNSQLGLFPLQNSSTLDEALMYIDAYYVDTINTDSITEQAIKQLTTSLDPHSEYIPAKDLQDFNSDFEGSFSGIGVQFSIQSDTVCVVGVVTGGPSEAAGVMNGDKIIMVDDSVFVGKNINNEKVMHTLRGEKGTKVKITVKREGTTEPLDYTITRGDIPVHSVLAKFIIEDNIGFIKVDKFSSTTYDEVFSALTELKAKGATSYILDLRSNPGGLMDQAIKICNEFLERGDVIVSAKGRQYPISMSAANGLGRFQNVPLAVLIDEFSASASEICAGAMQDNDRATIIGRRSFGKGLVQQVFNLKDNSAVKLTVARYYTPSGRCIQKPYKLGDQLDYYSELYERYEKGEIYNKDSIKEDSAVYKTKKGRIVHGGGGIMPDIFIGSDTSYFNTYYKTVINKNYTYQFAFHYTDKHRAELSAYTTWQKLDAYLSQQNIINQFVEYAKAKGVTPKSNELAQCGKEIERLLRAYIIRNMLNDEGFYPMYMKDDTVTKKAIEILN